MVQTEYQISKCHMISFVHYGCCYTGVENLVGSSFFLCLGRTAKTQRSQSETLQSNTSVPAPLQQAEVVK